MSKKRSWTRIIVFIILYPFTELIAKATLFWVSIMYALSTMLGYKNQIDAFMHQITDSEFHNSIATKHKEYILKGCIFIILSIYLIYLYFR